MFSVIFDPQLALRYDISTYSVKNADTADRYGQIITVGGDFSHTLLLSNPIQSNEYNGSRPRPLFPSLSKI